MSPLSLQPALRHRSAPRRSTRRGASATFLILGIGLLLTLGLAWWYSGRGQVEAGSFEQDRLVQVEERDVLDSVTASGRVEPLTRVAVMSRASGIIEELLVEEGDVVHEGQVLAELDREQLEAQLAQDEADLLAARARVEAARARVAEAETRLKDPELAFLEREEARLTQLLQDGDVSAREYEDAARALANARFRVDLVEASLPVLEASVAESEAQLAASEASLERSETALREATIRCPLDGVVLVRGKEVGDGVSSILTAGGNATQILILGDLSKMHIEARVDEVDLGRIHVDMPAEITVDAHRGRVLQGRVERIAPAGSIDNNGIVTFEVQIAVEDPDRLLRPDMTADAKLVVARRPGVPVLPHVAIQRGPNGAWVVDRVAGEGGTLRVERVPVQLGLSDGLQTEILSGLALGDRVLLPEARRPGR